MTALRWVLLIPACIATWYVVFMVGLVSHGYVERHFCPPAELVSGSCTNALVQRTLQFLIHAFVALSAIAVSVTATVVAPSHKEKVVWITLVCGTIVAAFFGFHANAWPLFFTASVAGVIVAMILVRTLRLRLLAK